MAGPLATPTRNAAVRRALPWLALPVILLLAGVVTYFFSGVGDDAPKSTPRVELKDDSKLARVSSAILWERAWGNAEDRVARPVRDGVPVGGLEAIERYAGGTLLVDHVPSWIGARLRWVEDSGEVLKTEFTPAGSTLFLPLEDGGVAYAVAKQASPSERLVVRKGTETTYTIPLNLNSGSVIRRGDDFYVTSIADAFDLEAQTYSRRDRLVPVVKAGRQVEDRDASNGASDGTLVGEDGKTYVLELTTQGFGLEQQLRKRVRRLPGGRRVEIPASASLLGVDREGHLWLVIEPTLRGRRTLDLPASPGMQPDTTEVLVTKMDGSVVARIIIPRSPLSVAARRPLSMSEGRLYATVADENGVRLVRYEVGR